MPTLWDIMTGNAGHKTTPSPAQAASPSTNTGGTATTKAPLTPGELSIYNPFGLTLGQSMRIKTLDLEDDTFIVEEITQSVPIIDGKLSDSTPQAFYDLIAYGNGPGYEQGTKKKRLWVVAEDGQDKDLSKSIVLLNVYEQYGYDPDVHKAMSFSENHGEIDEGQDHFWRVQDVKSEWEARLTKYSRLLNGKPPYISNITYWDFWRQTKDADEKDAIEFYIVSMDGFVHKDEQGNVTEREGSGEFTTWRGSKLEPSRIDVA